MTIECRKSITLAFDGKIVVGDFDNIFGDFNLKFGSKQFETYGFIFF